MKGIRTGIVFGIWFLLIFIYVNICLILQEEQKQTSHLQYIEQHGIPVKVMK